MSKLITSEFTRFFKSRIFYILPALCIGIPLFIVVEIKARMNSVTETVLLFDFLHGRLIILYSENLQLLFLSDCLSVGNSVENYTQ